MTLHPRIDVCCLALFTALVTGNFSARAADDPFAWPPITAQQKPWAFNWWMGSAVDKTNLTKELERYAAAGLGGIHIIPIYGAKGFEDKYINYLSPQWMEMMGWAVSEARRLGMDCDMTTGSGWCFGGPQVTDEDANANVVVRIARAQHGKPLPIGGDEISKAQAIVAVFADGSSKDLTGPLKNPLIDWYWTPPTNGCDIYIISQKPSGQKVKRPGPGGEGWMLNLIYPHAMDSFLKPYTAAFVAYTGPKPRAQYHDSYEYKSDWSPDFFAQFEKRRGYKLQNELPALFGTNNDEHSARVLCDYRQTVSEIMADSLKKWVNWSHERGFITRNQAHGSPGNWLDLYATADIPETEMFHTDRNKLISKFASSAAHVTGKPLVSAETGTWIEEHFTEKLSDVKYLFDDMFLSGVNHMFYHGCIYSPDEAPWPGWHFYASLEMNPRNSIWRDAPALNAYAARCQAILQSGQPDNDILLYYNAADFWMQPGDKLLPQLTVHARDWFEGQPIGKTAEELWERGYSFDYVSDAQLKTAKFVDGKIQMPGGKYQVIVVPECKYIPLETFKQLLALATNGATVIFEDKYTKQGALVLFDKQLPTDVSGLKDLKSQQAEFKKLTAGLDFQPYEPFFGRMWQAKVGKGIFACSHLVTDMWPFEKFTRETFAFRDMDYIRRSFDGGWNYFIVNQGEKDFNGWVWLAKPAKSVVILDPTTGNSGLAKSQLVSPGTKVWAHLAAGESVILRAFTDKKVEGPAWNYWQPNGQPVEITGQWNVKFISGGPTLPADLSTAKLASWTTFPDTNCQAFGGTAKYESTFDAPKSGSDASSHYELNLGNVAQSARVRVNGKDYGTLLTPPFRVVVDNLKPTGNTLEVEVTSVDANRIRDLDRRGVKWKTFRDINIVNLNYKPFDASDWPLTDCGLLGPVTLTPVTAK
jgi:hypothetical protein